MADNSKKFDIAGSTIPVNYAYTLSKGRVEKAITWDDIPKQMAEEWEYYAFPADKIDFTQSNPQLNTIIQQTAVANLGDDIKEEREFDRYKDPGVSTKAAREDHGHGNPPLGASTTGFPVGGSDLIYRQKLGKFILRNTVYRLIYNSRIGKVVLTPIIYHNPTIGKIIFR